jgi:hypothetical protein
MHFADRFFAAIATAGVFLDATAQPAAPAPSPDETQAHSPWLIVPLITNGPKLGTSYGGMVGYIMMLDEGSSPSLIALKATTSNTSSTVAGVFGKFSFHADRDRVVATISGGKVSNDYLDFLGTGREVRSDETLRLAFARYEHSVNGPLYLGLQWIYSNYDVEGADQVSDLTLEAAGLAGTVSSGAGVVLAYDTRDDINYPTMGVFGQLHNVASREFLGSDEDYDVVVADVSWYRSTSSRNVLALRGRTRFSWDAPVARESSIQMRGYTAGQYLGRNSLTFEFEDRYLYRPRWGAKIFGGVACLFGDGNSCDGEHVYPMIGVGAFYVLKPRERMVLNFEFADGEGDNSGLYLRFGNRF